MFGRKKKDSANALQLLKLTTARSAKQPAWLQMRMSLLPLPKARLMDTTQ